MIFSLISGLKINLHKCVVYWVGHDFQLASQLAFNIGCRVGSLPMKYFGLPLRDRMLCGAEWNGVVDAFRSKLAIWQARHLSLGGRLSLIKSVLSSISIYPHSVRLLPVRVRNTLHSIMSRFFWGGVKIEGNFIWSIGVS